MTHLSDPERKLLAILRNNSISKHRVKECRNRKNGKKAKKENKHDAGDEAT